MQWKDNASSAKKNSFISSTLIIWRIQEDVLLIKITMQRLANCLITLKLIMLIFCFTSLSIAGDDVVFNAKYYDGSKPDQVVIDFLQNIYLGEWMNAIKLFDQGATDELMNRMSRSKEIPLKNRINNRFSPPRLVLFDNESFAGEVPSSMLYIGNMLSTITLGNSCEKSPEVLGKVDILDQKKLYMVEAVLCFPEGGRSFTFFLTLELIDSKWLITGDIRILTMLEGLRNL